MKKAGAVVILLNDRDETLILLRPDNAHWAPHHWGFPGGKIEKNEKPDETATRETKEETQLSVANLKKITIDLPVEDFENQGVWAYYTRDYKGMLEIDYEHEDYVWVGRNTIEDYPLAPGVLEMYDWVLENE